MGLFRSLSLLLLLAGCPKSPSSAPPEPASRAAAPEPPAVDYAAIVAAGDRTEPDRALDAGRHPAETLAFFGIRPGMRVADLGAGGGYTTELLARAVGPGGRVYAQNSQFILDRFAAKPWAERAARPVNANVQAVVAPFDAPLPGLRDLDAVLMVLFYHDTVWQGSDRAKLNAAVFAALKPGGVYGIVDHAAIPGHGIADVETLHRIEEDVVKQEVMAAGFVLEAEADFLRNPADTRDWNGNPSSAGERRGTTDRFGLKFRKPL
jgi:predicted methyltransferase